MALTMRPAGLSSGVDKERADYTVFCGEWNIGRIYEVRGGPEHLRLGYPVQLLAVWGELLPDRLGEF
jgi:hypothetical protein